MEYDLPVAQMARGDDIEGFYVLKSAFSKVANNGKPFLNLTLSDRTGAVDAKVWDYPGPIGAADEGKVVKIRGSVSEFRGALQVTVERIRLAGEDDRYDVTALVPTAPIDGEAMYASVEALLDSITDADYKAVCRELLRRYSETRRRHPISIAEGLSTREAFRKERAILQPLKERADYTINTGLLSTSQNKERICDLFNQNGGAKSAMRLTVMSFGFKFGIPPEADLVLDVRCLPNPFYVPELKHKTGLDEEVVDFVMSHPEAQELLKRYESFLEYALPLYVKEGKSQLTIAVGCTGGKHRSITFARKIAEYCEKLGYKPGIQHRDSVR